MAKNKKNSKAIAEAHLLEKKDYYSKLKMVEKPGKKSTKMVKKPGKGK